MARFFISYSRSVKDEVGKVIDLLKASGHEVWWDGDIPIMADWWATILQNIEWCEAFIFVTSEKSVVSPYCLAELKYANDRQRPILPFILDDPSTLTMPAELPSRAQWLLYDGDPVVMLRQINSAGDAIDWRLHKDINAPRPPEPQKGGTSIARQYQQARQLANDQQFEEARHVFQNIKRLDYGEWGIECDEWIARLTSYASLLDLTADESTLDRARQAWRVHIREHGDDFDPARIRARITEQTARKRSLPLSAIALGVVALLVAVGLLGAMLLSGGDSSGSSLSSVELAQTETRQAEVAIAPTNSELLPAATNTDEPTVVIAPTLPSGIEPVISNAEWQSQYPDGLVQEFDGIEMVLVPAGCFMMGSEDGSDDESPVNEQCFSEPFWIDRTEVTQVDFERLGGTHASASRFDGENRPVEQITWIEARDFCAERRGMRLPTEREWEYAARGPDNLAYPWGNEWNGDNAVLRDNSDGETAEVGSILAGVSWAGALDMGGNVWEWVSTIYGQDAYPYPYEIDDGREDDNDTNGMRVLRGGSWYDSYTVNFRAAYRSEFDPGVWNYYIGFRCARSF